METVEEIRERHEAVMELERGLAELNQMFLDLASLVEHQGDMIDNIGHSVATAKEYTEQGVVALEQAHEYQKSARKKTCCIMMIVLGIGVVICWLLSPRWLTPIALVAGRGSRHSCEIGSPLSEAAGTVRRAPHAAVVALAQQELPCCGCMVAIRWSR
eukprot:scaffold4501_cov395-Prasinococcus_capsulatus_cf.AAC.19